ncbi:hypothetical protein [Gluconobacter frateurii]|uniref:Uncharacterized protein n=1 Tax=Gluconobacter frateurii NRIC 0228 TaxID=1307946 RepID=A0ABQ0QEE1_9PROT|nr:hypothetical protein [Gluconobacter frateurii]GBR15422.1 hypothetical protein AA0228_2508 [Gluconobacter frateurii NRIC 0228]GLP90304.1 hypothetical protein GCM10007868_13790 [Gluconobacter frateurii]
MPDVKPPGSYTQYLGILWHPESRIEDVQNLDADRPVSISVRQWVLLVTLIRLGSEGNSGAKCAIDLASVLQGFSWAQLARDGISSLGQAEPDLKMTSAPGHQSSGPSAHEISPGIYLGEGRERFGSEYRPKRNSRKANHVSMNDGLSETEIKAVAENVVANVLRRMFPSVSFEDSVAADPRNNSTPGTSEKGVNGDA